MPLHELAGEKALRDPFRRNGGKEPLRRFILGKVQVAKDKRPILDKIVGRQLLKNRATVAIVFSRGVSSEPTTADANDFANSARFLAAKMSR